MRIQFHSYREIPRAFLLNSEKVDSFLHDFHEFYKISGKDNRNYWVKFVRKRYIIANWYPLIFENESNQMNVKIIHNF